MTLRAFSGFILVMSVASSSLAQVGTIEEAIEAAVKGTEPEYVTELMAQLAQTIKQYLPKDLEHNPRKKLFCFQTMLEVMSASLDQAMSAAEKATTELVSAKKAAHNASTTSDWFKAVNAAFQASPYKDYAMSFSDPDLNSACWYDAWQAARKALEEEREAQKAARRAGTTWTHHPKLVSIAFQGAQWGALNWLLSNIEVITKTYDKIARDYDASDNPFRTRSSSSELYEKHFKGLSQRALVFLGPILVYLFPPDPPKVLRENNLGFMPYQPTLEEIAKSAALWFGDLPFPDAYPMY